MDCRRRSAWFLVAIIAAATAFAPSPRFSTANNFTPPPRRRRPIARIVPPKVAEYGAYGLAAYSAVELCWWGLPIGYALRSVDGALTVDAFFEVAKTPLLAAVFLWPNSWFRNGVSCKIAGALRDAVER
jgi:hypothetical protein